ncbi:hypothetical protein [Nannocystis pusilla]|uniref:hypothetical protein n=1 Tax=Nannocystis pusilla TaxID=889268 RepID=UPI003B7EB8BB
MGAGDHRRQPGGGAEIGRLQGAKYEELFPAPGIEFHALEGGAPPKLVARVCEP